MNSEEFRLRRNILQYYLQLYGRRLRDGALRWRVKPRLPRNFVFLHIPKAGGSSLRMYLSELFGAAAVYPEVRLNLPVPYAEVASGQPRLYMGHLGHQFAVEAGAIKATVLRDPVERLLSLYSYAINPGPRPPLIGGVRRDMTLLEFLRSEDLSIRMNVDNAQTWQIGYGYVPTERAAFAESQQGAIFDVAVANLAAMEHVGVLERLDRFKQQLADCYQVARQPSDQTINRSLSRLRYAELSGAEKAELEAVLEDDIHLYELARRRAQ